MTNLVWQEMGVLLASGAIGSLLVWGYQKCLKQWAQYSRGSLTSHPSMGRH